MGYREPTPRGDTEHSAFVPRRLVLLFHTNKSVSGDDKSVSGEFDPAGLTHCGS